MAIFKMIENLPECSSQSPQILRTVCPGSIDPFYISS